MVGGTSSKRVDVESYTIEKQQFISPLSSIIHLKSVLHRNIQVLDSLEISTDTDNSSEMSDGDGLRWIWW